MPNIQKVLPSLTFLLRLHLKYLNRNAGRNCVIKYFCGKNAMSKWVFLFEA